MNRKTQILLEMFWGRFKLILRDWLKDIIFFAWLPLAFHLYGVDFHASHNHDAIVKFFLIILHGATGYLIGWGIWAIVDYFLIKISRWWGGIKSMAEYKFVEEQQEAKRLQAEIKKKEKQKKMRLRLKKQREAEAKRVELVEDIKKHGTGEAPANVYSVVMTTGTEAEEFKPIKKKKKKKAKKKTKKVQAVPKSRLDVVNS